MKGHQCYSSPLRAECSLADRIPSMNKFSLLIILQTRRTTASDIKAEDHTSRARRARMKCSLGRGRAESLSLGEGEGLDWHGRERAAHSRTVACGSLSGPTEDSGIRSSPHQASQLTQINAKENAAAVVLRSNSDPGRNELDK